MTTGHIDTRFGDPSATALPWGAVEDLLRDAELYWLTTVRSDGRPHVAPLVGVWHDSRFVFCTGESEQKTVNLRTSDLVAVTTGANLWTSGTDVVVEGSAVRVTGHDRLEPLAAAWLAKYGQDWDWQATETGFAGDQPDEAIVYEVVPAKVIAFGKDPHSQVTYRP
jgi:hypothetical protein